MGWIATLAALAAIAILVFPPGLQAAEKVLCPAGTTIETNSDSLDALRRSSTAKIYSQYCTSPTKLADVTTRWLLFIGIGLTLTALCLFLRSRLTPPLLRAPAI